MCCFQGRGTSPAFSCFFMVFLFNFDEVRNFIKKLKKSKHYILWYEYIKTTFYCIFTLQRYILLLKFCKF